MFGNSAWRWLIALCSVLAISTPSLAQDEAAWQSFNEGILLLQKGAPRSQVLEHWQKALTDSPQSKYAAQLRDYIAQLKPQIEEDKKLAAGAVKAPEKLPLAERIAYYLERFPDVRGEQFSDPGFCSTVGMGEGTALSDAVVRIGRPAIPALIEKLNDRRLVRSVGWWRSYAKSRTVLRVQDVAIQCIHAILDQTFYERRSTSTYFSIEEPKTREKVIVDIKAWWKEYGHRPPIEGHIGRLEQLSLWRRFELLEKIEKLDPKAVNAVG
ncbi:MAG: hypothetical protein L0215_15435, partial [Gemmataceae bacterium]|nr:hypothetical protein [Gemmataceae bacterium]